MIDLKWMEAKEENPNEQQCQFRDNFNHLLVQCHVNISNFFKFINYYAHACVHMCAGTRASHRMYAGQRTTSRSWCSPSSVCLGIELRLLGLALLLPFPAQPSAHLNISETALLCNVLGSFTRDSLKASDFKTTF